VKSKQERWQGWEIFHLGDRKVARRKSLDRTELFEIVNKKAGGLELHRGIRYGKTVQGPLMEKEEL
jgi:hypothetical protein